MSSNKNSVSDTSFMPNDSVQPNSIFNESLFKELSILEKVSINQKTTCIDCLFPLCTPNEYEVYNTNTNEILYEFQEDSACLERFCFYRCRGFLMKINNIVSSDNNKSVLVEGRKTCGIGIISCFGCEKPKIIVDVKTPHGFMLGKIAMNWNSCCCPTCSSRIDIIDNTGKLLYIIKANRFAIGSYCWHCTKCCDILYHIIQNDKKVGNMKKLSCENCRICCTKGDQFSIIFPTIATAEEKMLLIIGCVLIDYQSFYL